MSDTISYQDILKVIAPCGLHCGMCFAYDKGDIAYFSNKLKENLGDFDEYALRFKSLLKNDIFGNYPHFKEMLNYFAKGSCKGCREEQCKLFQQCGVRPCHQEKGVDFCFQCEEFPCENTNFDNHLIKRWVKINNKIIKIGIKKYYQEIKDTPRY